MLQLHLFSRFQTGNPLLDTLISYFLLTVIMYFSTKLIDLLTHTKTLFLKLVHFTQANILKYLNRNKRKRFDKIVDISYITEDKKINELYKALHWHISRNSPDIDYLKETPIKFTYEEKISIDNKNSLLDNLRLNKHIMNNRSKELIYKKNRIFYSFSNEIITVHTDVERKRENYKISLSTEMDEYTKTDVIEEFCMFCLSEYIKNLTAMVWQQMIYVNEDDKWKSRWSNNYRKLDTIILKNQLKEEIKEDMQLFLNSEDWYRHRDIPYTRGYLFYGLPGTGKTSLIKGLSNHLKRHIHFLILSNVKDDFQLLELFKSINYKDTILVIEDIDCLTEIVRERNVVVESEEDEGEIKSKLTLSGLLNAIDGLFNNDGRILIMTTNKPEILDQALIRPGRIDRTWLFDFCSRVQIKELFEMFFEKPCDVGHLAMAEYTYSPAHLTALFMRYRESPEQALLNIDNLNLEIKIESLIKQRDVLKQNTLYEPKGNNPNINFIIK